VTAIPRTSASANFVVVSRAPYVVACSASVANALAGSVPSKSRFSWWNSPKIA